MLSAIRTSTGDELPGPEGLRKGSIATAAATGTRTNRGTAELMEAVDTGRRLLVVGDAIISARSRLVPWRGFATEGMLGGDAGACCARDGYMHAGEPGPCRHQPSHGIYLDALV